MKKKITNILLLFCFAINAQNIDVFLGSYLLRDMEFNGNNVYVSNSHKGTISIVNINDKNSLGSIFMKELESPFGLAFDGNSLYVAEESGNKISKIDISSANPTVTEFITGIEKPKDVIINGNFLYVSHGKYGKARVSVIDITKTTPTVTTLVNGLVSPRSLALDGNNLYIVDSSNRIYVTDISKETPTLEVFFSSLYSPSSITIEGDNMLILTYKSIYVLDIRDPSSTAKPLILGLTSASRAAIIDNNLYIISGDKILKRENILPIKDFLLKEPLEDLGYKCSSTNLLTDPSFEKEGLSIKEGKYCLTTSNNMSCVWEKNDGIQLTNDAYEGEYAYKISEGMLSQYNIDLSPNTNYILNGWIKVLTPTITGVEVGLFKGYRLTSTNGNWEKFSLPFTTGTDNLKVNLNLISGGNSSTTFDSLELCEYSTLSITKESLLNNVSIYPNPSKGIVNIDLSELEYDATVNIKVFNTIGQIVFHSKSINKDNYQFYFNNSPGLYFIEINSGNKKTHFKLLKE